MERPYRSLKRYAVNRVPLNSPLGDRGNGMNYYDETLRMMREAEKGSVVDKGNGLVWRC